MIYKVEVLVYVGLMLQWGYTLEEGLVTGMWKKIRKRPLVGV